MSNVSTRRFELVDAKSAKFWEISQDGAEYTVCFGKIGTKGRAKTKTLASHDAANVEVAKLIKEETGKGYVEVGAGSSQDIGVEITKPSNEKVISSTRAKATKSIRKVDAASKVLSDEDIAKIRKLIDSKSLNNLKMAIHLLESVEAKPMDWSKAFNKNVLDNLCESKDIEIYVLLANALKSEKGLMDSFVKASSRNFAGLEDLEGFIQKLFINYSEPLYLVANQLIKTLNSIINSDSFDPYRYGLDLNQLNTLSDSAASCLSAFKASQIDLNGLTSINAEATKILSKFRGHLKLDGVTELSEEAAINLINHKDKYHDNGISLNGLTEISDSVAVALGRKNGFLSLNGLTVLSEAAADALGRQKGELFLNGLNSISDGVARALSKHQHLHIEGLKYISDATAEYLSKYKHSLVLDGLISISDAAADALSNHKGSLSLDGLETISGPAAESLSKLKGSLSLDGLKTISDAAAKALSEHEGSLSLGGLKSISDAAGEALSRHNGYIFLKKSLEDKLIRFIKKSGKSRKSSK